MTDFLYQAFYCEENAWHLCQHPRLVGREPYVVWVLGPEGFCPLWAQRAATDPRGFICWDYHVMVFARAEDAPGWEVWDLDTTLPLPCPLPRYLRATFPHAGRLQPRFEPRFRLVPAEDYVREFSSDRRHMRDSRGRWQRPPPPWPAIHSGPASTFQRYRDIDDPVGGPVVRLDDLPHALC